MSVCQLASVLMAYLAERVTSICIDHAISTHYADQQRRPVIRLDQVWIHVRSFLVSQQWRGNESIRSDPVGFQYLNFEHDCLLEPFWFLAARCCLPLHLFKYSWRYFKNLVTRWVHFNANQSWRTVVHFPRRHYISLSAFAFVRQHVMPLLIRDISENDQVFV